MVTLCPVVLLPIYEHIHVIFFMDRVGGSVFSTMAYPLHDFCVFNWDILA